MFNSVGCAGSVRGEPGKNDSEPGLSGMCSCTVARSDSNRPWMYDRKGMPGVFFMLIFFFFCFFLLSQIYGLFPSVYNSGYPRQVSEDDNSCRFPNSDEPDVFTAFRVRMVDLVGWDNS